MKIFDAINLIDFDTTPEGFLVFRDVKIARTGIQEYVIGDGLGEIPAALFPGKRTKDVVRIYRPPEEVFSPESLDSIAGKPITIDHHGGFVDPENAGRLVVGWLGDSLRQEGDFVVGTVRVVHADGISAVRNGKREVSVGYGLDLEVSSGTTPTGESYDAIQKNIRGNHVALVERGRCGPSCRMQDGANSSDDCNCRRTEMSTKFVDCGGVQVEVSDAAAIAISSLLDKHTTEVTSLNQRILDMEAKTKESDEELAKAEAKAEESEKKATDAIAQTSPEALDALVAERLSVIDGAKKLAPDLEVKGLDSKAIKVAALEAIDVDLEGKSDAYIEAAFDARVDSAKAEPESHRAARQIADSAKGKSAKGGPVNFMDAAEKARQKVMDEKRNAHKRAAGGE